MGAYTNRHPIGYLLPLCVSTLIITFFVLTIMAFPASAATIDAPDGLITTDQSTLAQQDVTCGKPALSISRTAVYWASNSDYTAGILSVDYRLGNGGPCEALWVNVVGTVDTNGVISMNMPVPVGTLSVGSSSTITITYMLPPGIGSGATFKSTIYVFAGDPCGNFYNYPDRYPGDCG